MTGYSSWDGAKPWEKGEKFEQKPGPGGGPTTTVWPRGQHWNLGQRVFCSMTTIPIAVYLDVPLTAFEYRKRGNGLGHVDGMPISV